MEAGDALAAAVSTPIRTPDQPHPRPHGGDEALARLRRLYDGFSEGHATPPLQEAAALLRQHGPG